VAFEIADSGDGKGDFVGLVVLGCQCAVVPFDILSEQVGCQGEKNADAEDTVGSFRV